MDSESSSRLRLPHSCAECRRLKESRLKCDKNKPCSSCRRRGCASICPDGQMVSKGTRFILANTEKLHEKIEALIARVHQLEEALDASHSLHSNVPHTLLREELRRIATPVESAAPKPEPLVSKEDELAENIGTLTLDGHGHGYGSRYFGSTGAFAYLWREGDGPDGGVDPDLKYKWKTSIFLAELPADIAHLANAFPISLRVHDTSHLSAWIIENCLPPFPQAWSLFENYWEHYAWHSTPFTRSGFLEQILSPLYHRSTDSGDKPLGHRLAVLFMVFAIGEYMDFTQPLGPSSGLRYYLLARASLGLEPVFESPTVTALQALYLMGIFLMMSRGAWEPEHAWILSGINGKLALTLGLQHDAGKFNLPTGEVEARRQTLLSLLCFELWQSLSVGRSPSYTFSNFVWVLPKEPNLIQESSNFGQWPSFLWAAFFIRDCLARVVDVSVGNKETTYSAILALDSKIRDYPIPYIPSSDPSEEPPSIGREMRRLIISILKEVCSLYLHRRFFALALRDSPDDPLTSPYAPSVLACYRSASGFLAKIRNLHVALPDMTLRIWFIWPNVFVATLVVGSIVARCPGCSLAASALLELEMICQVWETTSVNVCGSKVLATVRRLKHKAFMAFAQNNGPKDPRSSGGIDVSDEIAALGGGGPRIISSSPKVGSSGLPRSGVDSSSYSPEQGSSFSLPPTSTSSGRPVDDFSPGTTAGPVRNPESSLFAGVPADEVFSSTASPFDFSSFDYSSPMTESRLPSDFDEIFQSMAEAGPTQIPTVGPTVLEELGLGGSWQPVMDDIGL